MPASEDVPDPKGSEVARVARPFKKDPEGPNVSWQQRALLPYDAPPIPSEADSQSPRPIWSAQSMKAHWIAA